MKLADSWQIRSVRYRTYLHVEVMSPGFAAFAAVPRVQRWLSFVDEPREAGYWQRTDCERWLRGQKLLDPAELEIVRAPACGCCGALHGIVWVGKAAGEPVYRCEKHKGRNPCLYEGCGKTFAHGPGEHYGWTIICGQHWRLGPKRMRDAVARVRRQAKKLGWSPKMRRRYHRLWERTVREIVNGTKLDEAEINRVMGWD